MNPGLREALDLVLTDVPALGAPEPTIVDDDWMRDPLMGSAWLVSADGSSVGVRVELGLSRADREMQVADQVQEWVIDEVRGTAATNWPPCPNHPEGHPLTPSTRDGRSVWVCPGDGMTFGRIGSLG